MSDTTLPAARVKPRRALLIASLALNVFFICATLAIVINHSGMSDRPRGPAARIDRIAATLPPEDGKVVKAEFNAISGALDTARQASRATQDKVRQALAATPYDPAAAAAAMDALGDSRSAVWSIFRDALLKAAAQMSPEGRAKLAEWVPSSDSHRRGGHGRQDRMQP
ncbi:periplasmic heavy metal sensor [Xanthobacteraceae bacterium A53D]